MIEARTTLVCLIDQSGFSSLLSPLMIHCLRLKYKSRNPSLVVSAEYHWAEKNQNAWRRIRIGNWAEIGSFKSSHRAKIASFYKKIAEFLSPLSNIFKNRDCLYASYNMVQSS